MATTTNYGWAVPNDTDLVKDGASAMRTLGQSIDTTFAELKGGTSGQMLTKASNTDNDYAWVTPEIGDITAVVAGTGLSGGGTTGSVTVSIDTATTVDKTTAQTLANKTLTQPIITLAYSAKTDNYTFVSGDEGNIFSMNNASTKQFRVPTDATYNFPVGTQFHMFWITGAGQPTIAAVTSGTTTVISTGATSNTPKLRVANSMATILKIAANTWIVTGDIA